MMPITMTSQWPRWRLKSPASRLFIQPFIQTQIKENIKAPRHWPLCGEFTGTGEFPAQRAGYAENVSIWWRHHVTLSVVTPQVVVMTTCDVTNDHNFGIKVTIDHQWVALDSWGNVYVWECYVLYACGWQIMAIIVMAWQVMAVCCDSCVNDSTQHHHNDLISGPCSFGPRFTKWTDVLPQDPAKSRSREI